MNNQLNLSTDQWIVEHEVALTTIASARWMTQLAIDGPYSPEDLPEVLDILVLRQRKLSQDKIADYLVAKADSNWTRDRVRTRLEHLRSDLRQRARS